MTRTTQFTVGLVAGVSLLGLSATPLMAGHYKEVSDQHTNWGISQLNAMDLDDQSDMVV